MRAWVNRPTTWRILLGVFGCVLFVFVAVPVSHSIRGQSTKDYGVWYQAGQTVLQGGELYPDPRLKKFPFMYPPVCALFLAPVAALGQTGLVVVLALINAAAWICSIIFSVRLATGKWRGADILLYLAPSLLMSAHVWGNFLLGQPSLVLLALMLGAFIGLQRQLYWLAGALVAIAAAIKAFPIIAIVYLIYRRYSIATKSLLLTLTILLALLLPLRGYGQAKEDLGRWSSGMLFKYDETGTAQRPGRSYSWKNQSIWGVANRLLRHMEYDQKYEPHKPVYANFVDLDFKTVNAIILVSALGLGLVFITLMPRTTRRTRETDAIEFALLLLLILIFTPLSFGYLFVWLLYPLTVVGQCLLSGSASRGLLLGCAGTALALLALMIPFRVTAQVYGNLLFVALLLFAGLSSELWNRKRGAISWP